MGSNGDAQTSVLTARAKTVSNSAVQLTLDGGSTEMKIAANTAWAVNATVVGMKEDGSASVSFEVKGMVRRDGTANVVLDGQTATTIFNGMGVTAPAIAVTGADTVRLNVYGAASTNMNWVARIELTQVSVTG